MSVHKSGARLFASDGSVIGEGRAYVHLPRPASEAQVAQGTLSLDWWNDGTPAFLELANGPRLPLTVQTDKLSGCIQGRVLRYTTEWPGAS
jgi:hypothetical protein